MYYTISVWGHRHFFETLEEVVHNYWSYFYSEDHWHLIRIYEARTCQRVDDDLIIEAVRFYRKRIYNRWRRKRDYIFRSGPVPGIRSWKASVGHYRRPRTKQELSQEPTRASRGKTYLPTVRDGNRRKPERNWKSQRKTQWKNL